MELDFLPHDNSRLTQEELERLLSWLDPDRGNAGKKYKHIRARLLELFQSNGCEAPETLTDTATLRVIGNISKLGTSESDTDAIFQKAARKILRDYLKLWATTKEAFDRLLLWLDADREQASHRYRRIHLTLSAIFRSHGFPDAESLADEAIYRVLRRLPELERSYEGNPALYFSGVAKKICHEHTRSRESSRRAHIEYGRFLESVETVPLHPRDEGESRQHKCFYKCLQRLKPDDRELLLGYYQEEKDEKIKNRRELARSLGITTGNLRVRRHRIYTSLVDCIGRCLENEAGEGLN